jgi:hypothetical protein
MKVSDKVHARMAEGKPFFSFEYFPPRTEEVGNRGAGRRRWRAAALECVFAIRGQLGAPLETHTGLMPTSEALANSLRVLIPWRWAVLPTAGR